MWCSVQGQQSIPIAASYALQVCSETQGAQLLKGQRRDDPTHADFN